MKGKTGSGHDGINSILLRKIKLSVCITLAAIINKSLEIAEVPNSLKLAKVDTVICRVPQAQSSVLRPLLLSIYINDLPRN